MVVVRAARRFVETMSPLSSHFFHLQPSQNLKLIVQHAVAVSFELKAQAKLARGVLVSRVGVGA